MWKLIIRRSDRDDWQVIELPSYGAALLRRKSMYRQVPVEWTAIVRNR